MSQQSSSRSNVITLLFIAAGVTLLVAGGLNRLPSIGAASDLAPESTPVDFGEQMPPLRPTVTPLPFASQLTPEPALLPDSSAQTQNAPARRLPAPKPRPVDLAGNIPTRLVISAISFSTRRSRKWAGTPSMGSASGTCPIILRQAG
jgi:hypothetical protein